MMSEVEFLQFILECIEEGGEAEWPLYVPPGRVPQSVEPEPQQESRLIEVAPEIATPPVETAEPIAEEPKRHPALANVYSWVTNPLSGPK